ncbi:MAG: tetratricopeptide repeat-containing sulfotransferase family protein [Glycocaulis sp.]
MEDRAILQRAADQVRGALGSGDLAKIIAAYRKVLGDHPSLADFWFDLGYYLRKNDQPTEALEAYDKALALGADGPEIVHLNRAVIFSDDLLDDERALGALDAALECNPACLPALLNLGNLREERGELDAAIACYERMLAAPATEDGRAGDHAVEAQARLVRLQALSGGGDAALVRLRADFESGDRLPAELRAKLGFTLGQVLDRLGRYEEAFDAFLKANAIARAGCPPYDRARTERAVDALITAPVPDRSRSGSGGGADLIFICGLHRSGSSLIERVLSMHPRVSASGELGFIQRLAGRELAPFPAGLAGLDRQRSAELAERYRARLALLHPGAGKADSVYTDKRPQNFLLIGLVLTLFPEARIIHTVRDPRDIMISMFGQYLDPRGAAYSTRLEDIAHYMGLHRKLADHWRSLYPQSILDFDYDAFVRSPQDGLEALTEFAGLDADPGLLDFHRKPGTVRTASYWQVRSPLNTASSGRWRAYAEQMEPALRLLQEGGLIAQSS